MLYIAFPCLIYFIALSLYLLILPFLGSSFSGFLHLFFCLFKEFLSFKSFFPNNSYFSSYSVHFLPKKLFVFSVCRCESPWKVTVADSSSELPRIPILNAHVQACREEGEARGRPARRYNVPGPQWGCALLALSGHLRLKGSQWARSSERRLPQTPGTCPRLTFSLSSAARALRCMNFLTWGSLDSFLFYATSHF